MSQVIECEEAAGAIVIPPPCDREVQHVSHP